MICVKKELGGRSFRNLHFFNLAFLGKMGWRLLSDQEALVCRILKARYYPNCSFLDAGLGGNPSFSWSSIHAVQDLIRRGVRWKVGDGHLFSLWFDPWIRDDSNFFITSLVVEGIYDLTVEMGHGVYSQFLPLDKDMILGTSLPPSGFPDKLTWHFSRDGAYSVKLAYNLDSSLVLDARYEVLGDWKSLWKLQIPPRVKDYLWRAARDCLPNKNNLFYKRVADNKLCVMCGAGIENIWHACIN
ncbi:hypothetical protein ACS0TY_007485 [Phlomoides rotata]